MSDDNTQVEEWLSRRREVGDAVCEGLNGEIRKLGFSVTDDEKISLSDAQFTLSRDPSDGGESLIGSWVDIKGRRVGSILFHNDGSFYAEYDVVQPHPTDKRWFVEAVTAWGRGGVVKTEPRLLAAV